jgi:folate-binding protein YgfZ
VTTIDTSTYIDPDARDRVTVRGGDAHSYLQSQLSQDITDLAVGSDRWTFVLDPSGKVDVLARIARTEDDVFVLDTDAGYGESLAARLSRFKIRVDAEIEVITAIAETSSVEIETARIVAGWPRMGSEIVPGETIPATTGVLELAVSFTKGCYPGQELVERMHSRGADAPRLLRVVFVDAGAVAGDPILDGSGDEVGEVTSVSPAGDVALGYVKRGSDVGTIPAHSG